MPNKEGNDLELVIPHEAIGGSQTFEFKDLLKTNRLDSMKRLHTYEFRYTLRHDTNFNNIQMAIKESLFSAEFIRHPPPDTLNAINDLCERLQNVMSSAINAGDTGNEFREFLKKDTGIDGQFGQITGGIEEMNRILRNKEIDPRVFVQKILMIKSFGAYIIDIASKKPQGNEFIFANSSKGDVDRLIKKYRPNDLFDVRGRSTNKQNRNKYREDIGILDEPTLRSTLLSESQRESLIIPGLSKKRLVFRTFTHEVIDGERIEVPFVNRTFDKDLPLIGAVSGSTSCIMVGSNILYPDMSDKDRQALAKSAVAFLVGGGYHSATEVLDVAYPNLNIYDY